jgi:hypothetical protein
VEYRHQRKPVEKIANCWLTEMFSAGLFMSLMLERVMAHLKVGAQKKMVSGPAGCASSVFIGEGSGEANKAAYNAGTKLMGI